MGNFREIKGDLLSLADKGQFDIIMHGCNCQNIMGAGIALQIKKRFPQAYEADTAFFKHHVPGDLFAKYVPMTSLLLGNFSGTYVSCKDEPKKELLIINAYTQILPGANFDMCAFSTVLKKVNLLYSGQKIGIPLIGAGIGGGNWESIKQGVQAFLSDMDVTVVHFSPEENKEEKSIERRTL